MRSRLDNALPVSLAPSSCGPRKCHRQHARLRGHENVTGIVACSGIDGYYMDVEDNYEMESMVGLWLSLMMI